MPKPTSKIKRLFLDCEVTPNVGLFWQPGYKISISHENIVKERAIICIAYKWAGEKKIRCLQWDKDQNDKAMLEKIVKVMNEADEIVAHNGDRFDLTWIRTRCLFHNIPMMPHYVTIDTLKLARGRFKFNSNRLDYIAKFLGFGGKKDTSFDLWKDITLNKCAKSMKIMVTYCKHDVVLLEKVWDRLNSYVVAKSSIADYPSQCPECGSDETVINQRRKTAAGYNKVTFRCKSCGKYTTMSAGRFDKDKARN